MTRIQILVFLLSALASQVATAQWQSLNGPPGANVRDMERTPDGSLYVVANLKLFKSTNNSDSWQQVQIESPANIDFEAITFDAAGNLYGVNYSRLYKSTDKGLNWVLLSKDGDFYGTNRVQIFGPDHYFAVFGWNGIYVSTDQAASWTKIWNKEPSDLKVNAAGDIFITTSNDTYDEGLIMKYAYPGSTPAWNISNWSKVYTSTGNSGYDMRLLIDLSSNIYASVYNDLILSSSNGTNWSSIKSNITETNFTQGVWALAPNGTVYLTNGYRPNDTSPVKIYSTTTQGADWSINVSPTDVYGSVPTSICFSSASTIFMGSDNDGVFRSQDSGNTWTLKSAGLLAGAGQDIVVTNSGRIIYLSNYRPKGYWTSTDNGVSWSFVTIGNYFRKILKLSDGTIMLYSGGPDYRSKDDGASFSKINDLYVNAMVEDASGKLYGADYNAIFVSVNQGENWTNLNASVTGLPANYYSYYIAIDAANSNLFVWLYNYAESKDQLYKVPVAGGAATTITGGPWEKGDSNIGVKNVFVSEDNLYIAAGDAIYESGDGGDTWSIIGFSGQRVFPIEGGLCVSQSGSLYITQDEGKSWNSTTLPTGIAVISDIVPVSDGFLASALNSAALKFTGQLILPANELPPYIDFDWQPTDGPYGGYVDEVFSDNAQNSYVLTEGRLFKTLTFANWQRLYLSPRGYVYDAVIDKSNNSIYAVQYNTLQKSGDGGVTWNIKSTEPLSCPYHLVKCGNGTIAFSSSCGAKVFISTDDGATFGPPKLDLANPNLYISSIVSTASSAILATIYDYSTYKLKLVRSKNNGDSWEDVTVPYTTEYFGVGTAGSGLLYIYSGNRVYRSSDDGDHWENMSGDLAGGYINAEGAPVFDPSGNILMAGYRDADSQYGFWKSSNDGNNWTFLPSDFISRQMNAVGTRMVAGSSDGVYTSDDACVTFTRRSTGIYPRSYSDLAILSPSEMAGLSFGNSYSTTDFTSWNTRKDFKGSYFFKKPDGVLLSWAGTDIFSTPDNGISWVKAGSCDEYVNYLTSPDGALFFVVTSSGKIKYTDDFQVWNQLTITGLPSSYQISSIAANTSGFIFISLYNYDNNQSEAYQVLYGSAVKINDAKRPVNLFYSYSDANILLYDAAGSILETTDGSRWTVKSAPAGDKLFITEKDYYFVPQFNGTLWLSRNKGQTWQSVGAGNNIYVDDIVINEYDGHAYAAIEDGVVYKSGNIVIPPETVAPLTTSLSPANNATDVSATTTLNLTFDEVVNPVSGKKIRIVDVANPINPVELIDATMGTREGKTFVFRPVTPLVYEKSYFIVVDNGAFTDIFGNAFAGITNNTIWRFTIQSEPDNSKPTITYSAANPAFAKGGANKLQINVADETGGTGVNNSSVKLYYRGILSSSVPSTAAMTLASGNTFEVSIPDNWLDELGLEFKFEAQDNAGNLQTLPSDGTYYQGYISFPTVVNPTLPSSVLSFGGQLENYRVFSVPYKLSDGKMSTVFNELSGQQVKADFRILHYNTESDQYSEYPALSTIARGLGYWINIKTNTTIAVENASTPENSKETPATLSLKPGWNQIGNPYPFTISWNAVRTASGNANIGVLKTFNGTGWMEDDKMNPFEGGFVLLGGTGNVNVTVPLTAKTTSGRVKEEPSPDWEEGWWLPLTVTNSRFRSVGGVGMHLNANLGFDGYDDAAPPEIFPLPKISFQHDEHFLKRFTRDVIAPREQFIWDFTVDGGGEPAVLSWDVSKVRSLAHKTYLFDIAAQQLVDMSEKDHHQISSPKAIFKLFYGIPRKDIKPSKIVLNKPYPNPFTRHAQISFTLPENTSGTYSLSLNVYDALGRPVATLAQGQYSAGFYVADWEPDPASGPSSFYLIRLVASDRKSNVILTEKLIAKK